VQASDLDAVLDRVVIQSGRAQLIASHLPVLEPARPRDRLLANPSGWGIVPRIDVFG
jgi:hypothetical protein